MDSLFFSGFPGKKSRGFLWDCMLLWKLQRFHVLSYCKHLDLVFPLPYYLTLLHTTQHLRRAKHSHIIFIINWCPWQIQQVKCTVLLCRPNISHSPSTLLSLFLTYREKGECLGNPCPWMVLFELMEQAHGGAVNPSLNCTLLADASHLHKPSSPRVPALRWFLWQIHPGSL